MTSGRKQIECRIPVETYSDDGMTRNQHDFTGYCVLGIPTATGAGRAVAIFQQPRARNATSTENRAAT